MKLSVPTPRISLPALRRGGARQVVGLDIEPGAVRAARTRVEDGRLVVDRAESAVLDPSVVRDGEIADAAGLAEGLRALFADAGLDRSVRVGLANQRVVVRHLLLPVIADAREMAAAVRFMAGDELPIPVDQAVIDHRVLGVVETPEGPRTRVLLVAARRSSIDALLAVLRSAGLRPEGIDLAAFAMLRTRPAGAPDALHLCLGGITNLAVTRGGECVFTRVLPGGLEAMAAEVAERAGATADEARAALRAAGGAGERAPEGDALTGVAAGVLDAGLRRIAAEARTSVDFHLAAQPLLGAADEGAGIDRAVLTGSAAMLPRAIACLEEALGLAVEIGEVAGVEDGPAYAVAAGLSVEEAPR